jgi:hypothetical protein
MPANLNFTLKFLTKCYKIFDNQSIVVWDVKGDEDIKFHFQLRFIQKKFQKLNLSQLESDLKAHIVKIRTNNSLYFNDENKIKFLIALRKLGIDLKLTEIIQNNSRFKINNQSNLLKAHDKNLITLFCLDSSTNFNLGYELPKDPTENNAPLCCASIFSGKQLSKKIYLFPSNAQSLTNAVDTLKTNPSINLQNLGIPYVEYVPANSNSSQPYDREIQVRINLQAVICEILTHLEKSKCFRKNGSEKTNIFVNLAKDIASSKPIGTISTQLNAHDTWKLLAQHRDPWGFFAFFKGKTHSLIAWEELRNIISEFNNSISPSQAFAR